MSKFRTRQLWPVLTIILAIILVWTYFSGGVSTNGIGEDEAGTVVVDFINENLLQGKAEATLTKIEETSGLYIATLELQGQELPVYLTKDGEYLFPQGINLKEFEEMLEEGDGQTETEPVEITITEEDHVLGEADAPVTIVEYSDLECPFCKEWHGVDAIPSRPIDQEKAFDKLKEEYIDTGKVKFVFRHFPLSFHKNAQKAGEAVECAAEENKFWELHEKLFEATDLSLENIKAIAEELGLDIEKFNECLDSGKYEEKITNDIAKGAELGITGTPAFVINGKLISGAVPFATLKTEIDKYLE